MSPKTLKALRKQLENDNERRLFDLLLAPENNQNGYRNETPPAEELLEEYEDFGGEFVELYEAQQVADRLHEAYSNPDFTFGFDCNSEGEVSMYSIGIYLGHEIGCYLLEFHETKYLRTERRGIHAAIDLADTLETDYRRVLDKARKAGLLKEAA